MRKHWQGCKSDYSLLHAPCLTDWILDFNSVFCLWFHASACPLSDASSPGTRLCFCPWIYAPAKPLVYSA
ncbi:hypothetical protein CRENBAI_004327 [Crenichthys baileyi]|uniref:Uncharacterized protein n=1 Tax=Crenichthys baileyi TaxID=28760 RepID=A0AAV9R3Q8_9TELE